MLLFHLHLSCVNILECRHAPQLIAPKHHLSSSPAAAYQNIVTLGANKAAMPAWKTLVRHKGLPLAHCMPCKVQA